jgi:hypothetical protein
MPDELEVDELRVILGNTHQSDLTHAIQEIVDKINQLVRAVNALNEDT